jgi:hypothetical protein
VRSFEHFSSLLNQRYLAMRRALNRSSAVTAVTGLERRLQGTLVAWGSNVDGQIRPEAQQFFTGPQEVEALRGEEVVALAAGDKHSAAVTASGHAWTWGSGRALGRGSGSRSAPHRLESLAERASVVDVAAGNGHTLFLDAVGGVWRCSDEGGRAGHGAPSIGGGAWVPGEAPLRAGAAAAEGLIAASSSLSGLRGGAQAAAAPVSSSPGEHHHPQQQPVHHQGQGWIGSHLRPFIDHSAMEAELRRAQSLYAPETHRAVAGWRTAAAQLAALRAAHDHERMSWPVRVGGGSFGAGLAGADEPAGLEGRRVLAISAGRHGGAALTSCGEIWAVGGGWGGAEGRHGSVRTGDTAAATAVEAQGGATSVAAGSGFAAALTASGRVVVWGPRSGADGPLGLVGAVGYVHLSGNGPDAPRVRAFFGSESVVYECLGLPRLTALSAGSSHVLMSDGGRVWQLGGAGGLDLNASESAPAQKADGRGLASWGAPRLVLDLSSEGVACLAAGPAASAVVTLGGRLFVWGSVAVSGSGSSRLCLFSSSFFFTIRLNVALDHQGFWRSVKKSVSGAHLALTFSPDSRLYPDRSLRLMRRRYDGGGPVRATPVPPGPA